MKQILMDGFSSTLDTGQVEDLQMVKDKLVDGKKLLVGLVMMIKDAGSKFDDYSISPKIRQILLHWGYELTEKDFFINSTN